MLSFVYSWWYMVGRLFLGWVKNVHSLWIAGRIDSGLLPTQTALFEALDAVAVNKHLFTPLVVHGFYPQYSTTKNWLSPLFLHSFTRYPQGLLLLKRKEILKR